ncbi:hypothetical protein [Levilactobacillus huananensis]
MFLVPFLAASCPNTQIVRATTH